MPRINMIPTMHLFSPHQVVVPAVSRPGPMGFMPPQGAHAFEPPVRNRSDLIRRMRGLALLARTMYLPLLPSAVPSIDNSKPRGIIALPLSIATTPPPCYSLLIRCRMKKGTCQGKAEGPIVITVQSRRHPFPIVGPPVK